MAIMPINFYGNMKTRQINLINSWGSPAKKKQMVNLCKGLEINSFRCGIYNEAK